MEQWSWWKKWCNNSGYIFVKSEHWKERKGKEGNWSTVSSFYFSVTGLSALVYIILFTMSTTYILGIIIYILGKKF